MDDNNDDGHISLSSHASSGKSEQIRLLEQDLLRQSLTRQETHELYQKLQSEYDKLLAKHAQAENTIDQLRIGARVNLFSDGPLPHQAEQMQIIEVRVNPQPISVPLKERATNQHPGLSASTTTGDYIDNANEGDESKKFKSRRASSSILHRVKDLQNDIIAFQSALADRELVYEQQNNLYNALKDKLEDLKRELKETNKDNEKTQGTSTFDR